MIDTGSIQKPLATLEVASPSTSPVSTGKDVVPSADDSGKLSEVKNKYCVLD